MLSRLPGVDPRNAPRASSVLFAWSMRPCVHLANEALSEKTELELDGSVWLIHSRVWPVYWGDLKLKQLPYVKWDQGHLHTYLAELMQRFLKTTRV